MPDLAIVLAQAWTIRKGFKAPQAAGCIHTDFEKKFIMAEVQAFSDLKEPPIFPEILALQFFSH